MRLRLLALPGFPDRRAHSYQTARMAEALENAGVETVVIHQWAGGAVPWDDLAAMYGVRRPPRHQALVGSRATASSPLAPFRDRMFTMSLHLEAMRATNGDVFYGRHAHKPPMQRLLAIRAAGRTHARIVIELHEAWHFRADLDPYVAGYVVIAHSLARFLMEQGVPTDRILVAPNGVDDRLFASARSAGREALRAALGLAPDRKYVCYTGQLFAGRNVEAIVEALTRLPREFNTLLVGGESAADMERVASHAERHGVGDRIRLIGHQPSAIAATCQVAADVLVLPYHPDTTRTAEWCSPLKAAEYVASGTPIAAYRLSALEEFFAPDEVSWAPDLTISGLAAAIADASRRTAPIPRDARRLDALSWATRARRIARFVEARRG